MSVIPIKADGSKHAELRVDSCMCGSNEKVSIAVRKFVNGMHDLNGLVGT